MWRHASRCAVLGSAIVAALTGCERRPDPEVDDPRAHALGALVADGEHCLDDEPAYCLTDDALLASVLDECLEGQRDGLPTTERALDAFVRRCGSTYYRAQLATPANRARVEALVRARFDDPPSRVEGARVFADLGALPAELERVRGVDWTLGTTSELARAGLLTPAAVAEVSLRLRREHPDASVIAFRVEMPRRSGGRGDREHIYAWHVADDRVTVTRGGDRDVTEAPLGPELTPLASSTDPLHELLHDCGGEGSDVDPLCPDWWPTAVMFGELTEP